MLCLEEIIQVIKDTYSEDQSSTILSALLYDSRIIQGFKDLHHKKIEKIDRVDKWSPLFLFTLIEDYEDFYQQLISNTPLEKVSANLFRKIQTIFETEKPPSDFSSEIVEAGYRALLIRQLILENTSFQKQLKNIPSRVELLVFACLIPFLESNPQFIDEFITACLTITKIENIIESYLCIPFDSKCTQVLSKLMNHISEQQRIKVLKKINQTGFAKHGKMLVDYLLSLENQNEISNDLTQPNNFNEIKHLQYLAALAFFNKNIDQVKEIHQQIDRKLMDFREENYYYLRSIEKNTFSTDANSNKTGIYSEENTNHELMDPREQSGKVDILFLFEKIIKMHDNVNVKTLSLSEILQRLIGICEIDKNALFLLPVYNWSPVDFVKYFSVYEPGNNIIKLTEYLVSLFPNDPILRFMLSEMVWKKGDEESAIEHAFIALSISPLRTNLKWLLDMYEEAQNWTKIISLIRKFDIHDGEQETLMPLFVRALLRSGDINSAISFLKESENTLNNLTKNLLWVELYLEQNELLKAEEIITSQLNTSEINPTLYETWIDLTLLKGQNKNIENIILEGLSFFPENKDLLLRLIKNYFEANELEKAFFRMERLHSLESSHKGIVCSFFDYLTSKNFYKQATYLIKIAYETWPLNNEVIFRYCVALVESENFAEAEKIFTSNKSKIYSDLKFLQLYLIFILGCKPSSFPLKIKDRDDEINHEWEKLKRQMQKGIHDDLLWNIVGIEIGKQEGEKEKTFAGYREILLNPEFVYHSELWRAQVGLATLYIDVGHLDSAIALLHEANKIKPYFLPLEDLLVRTLLKNAYYADALQRVRDVYKANKGNLEYLSWFAEMSLLLGCPDEGYEALKELHERNNAEIEVLLCFAEFCHKIGDLNKYFELLSKLQNIDQLTNEQFEKILPLIIETLDQEKTSEFIIKIPDEILVTYPILLLIKAGYYYQNNQSLKIQHLLTISENNSQSNFYCRVIQAQIFKEVGDIENAFVAYLETIDVIEQTNIVDLLNKFECICKIIPESWVQVLENPTQIFMNAISLGVQLNRWNDLISILHNFDIHSNNKLVKYLRLHIFKAMNDTQKLEELLNSYVELLDKNVRTIEDDEYIFSALLGILAECALDSGEEVYAGSLISKGISLKYTHNRFLFAQSRLLYRNQNILESQNILKQGLAQLIQNINTKENNGGITESIKILNQIDQYPSWAIDAAIETKDWEAVGHLLTLTNDELNYDPFFALQKLRAYCFYIESENRKKQLGAINEDRIINNLSEDYLIIEKINIESPSLLKQFSKWKSRIDWIELNIEPDINLFCENKEDAVILLAIFLNNNKIDNAKLLIEKFNDEESVAIEGAIHFNVDIANEILQSLHKCLQKNPNNPYLYAALYKVALKVNDIELAGSSIANAVNLKPDETQWKIWLADSYKAKGDMYAYFLCMKNMSENHFVDEKVIKEYIHLLIHHKQYKTAIHYYENLCEKFQMDCESMSDVVSAYINLNNFRKAINLIEKNQRANPNCLWPHIQKSEIALQSGNIMKALSFIQEAMRMISTDWFVHSHFAKVKSIMEGDKVAYDYLLQSLNNRNSNSDIQIEIADYVAKLYSKEKALNYLEQVTKAGIESAHILSKKGIFYDEIGKIEDALHNYQESLVMENNQPEIQFQVGLIYKDQGNLDKAIQHLNSAICFAPFEIDSYLLLAEIYFMRNEISNAEMILEKAKLLNSSDSQMDLKLTEIYKINKKTHLAKSTLYELESLKPKNKEINDRLGQSVVQNIINQSHSHIVVE